MGMREQGIIVFGACIVCWQECLRLRLLAPCGWQGWQRAPRMPWTGLERGGEFPLPWCGEGSTKYTKLSLESLESHICACPWMKDTCQTPHCLSSYAAKVAKLVRPCSTDAELAGLEAITQSWNGVHSKRCEVAQALQL
eukprot:779378-Pelagomonas_calceolata.AAC.1